MADAHPGRLGRNNPCHCGSGKKYKHCCLAKDEEADRTARAENAAAAQAEPAADEPAQRVTPPPRTTQPWKRTVPNPRFTRRITTPRKAG
jgi:hypothetical protein